MVCTKPQERRLLLGAPRGEDLPLGIGLVVPRVAKEGVHLAQARFDRLGVQTRVVVGREIGQREALERQAAEGGSAVLEGFRGRASADEARHCGCGLGLSLGDERTKGGVELATHGGLHADGDEEGDEGADEGARRVSWVAGGALRGGRKVGKVSAARAVRVIGVDGRDGR